MWRDIANSMDPNANLRRRLTEFDFWSYYIGLFFPED
jgi:hypothetical protein